MGTNLGAFRHQYRTRLIWNAILTIFLVAIEVSFLKFEPHFDLGFLEANNAVVAAMTRVVSSVSIYMIAGAMVAILVIVFALAFTDSKLVRTSGPEYILLIINWIMGVMIPPAFVVLIASVHTNERNFGEMFQVQVLLLGIFAIFRILDQYLNRPQASHTELPQAMRS
jgi:membrane protease YdiL (CAAX protease family)